MLRIVLTGGPCGGKTQITNRLIQDLEEKGYYVFVVPETATELLTNGIKPSGLLKNIDFQRFVLEKQLAKEELYNKLENFYPKDKIIILYDRGIMDNSAYISKNNFDKLLKEKGLSVAEVYEHYDAVFHLVTAAKGAIEYYQWNNPVSKTECNNSARLESPQEAIAKDMDTLNAWIGYPHLRVFDNSTDFEGKVLRVKEEIYNMLGVPVPKEIERKFLIKIPTYDEYNKLGYVVKTHILQTYLKSKDGIERRVRQRGNPTTGYNFYYTEKQEIRNGERFENEYKISYKEFINYLTQADTTLHQISKTRYCFIFENRYFEMDIYPFSQEYAILEVEVNSLDEKVKLPPVSIIREVTGDKSFNNYELSKRYAFE